MKCVQIFNGKKLNTFKNNPIMSTGKHRDAIPCTSIYLL